MLELGASFCTIEIWCHDREVGKGMNGLDVEGCGDARGL
jgi:hypothetical protein